MSAVTDDKARLPRALVILLVSLAGLLLEVGYTRIISYKLWYYYTYLVIGLALLGIGSGSVFVAVCSPVRRWTTDRIVALSATCGAISIALGYLVVAVLHVNTIVIWDYGTRASFTNLGRLGLICFAIFVTFISFGIIVSVLLGRARGGVGRMYFSDLVGAGAGCVLAIPLITHLGPPRVVMLAALDLRRRRFGVVSSQIAAVRLRRPHQRGARRDRRRERRLAGHTHRGRQAAYADHAVHRLGSGVPRRRHPGRSDHIQLSARARRDIRFRHPTVQREPGVDQGVLRQRSAFDSVPRARRSPAA